MERDRMRASNEWAASFSIFRHHHHQHRISHHNIPHMTIPASIPTATHPSNLIVILIIRVRIPGVQFQFQHQSIDFRFPMVQSTSSIHSSVCSRRSITSPQREAPFLQFSVSIVFLCSMRGVGECILKFVCLAKLSYTGSASRQSMEGRNGLISYF